MLTIVSLCVLPFVFARAGRPFVSSTLLMLAGMAVVFAATGLPWAPCAGPVLGGASVHASLLLAAYAAGAATSLALALLVGRPGVRRHEALAGVGQRVRRVAGVASGITIAARATTPAPSE